MVTEETVRSWQHLIERLYANSWNADIDRFRSPFAFRGITDAKWSLVTSAQRLGGNVALLERHLLRNFRKYAHRDVVERDSLWYWLTMAQHHGLPTRLLDWTYSPFVAMHFATDNLANMDRDGLIWVVDYTKVHSLLPAPFSTVLRDEGSVVFTVEMLSRFDLPKVASRAASASTGLGGTTAIRDLQDFDSMVTPPADPFLLFFEPPSIDDRVVNQYALFSVMPTATVTMDDWLSKHPDLGVKLIIPSALKWEIRDKLDQANINERVLFPGLDGLSKWLRRHYTSRPT